LKGVALWFPRDFKPNLSFVKILTLASRFKLNALLSMIKLMANVEKKDKMSDLTGHWRLQWLGIDPKLLNGNRYVAKLVNPVLEWSDQVNIRFIWDD